MATPTCTRCDVFIPQHGFRLLKQPLNKIMTMQVNIIDGNKQVKPLALRCFGVQLMSLTVFPYLIFLPHIDIVLMQLYRSIFYCSVGFSGEGGVILIDPSQFLHISTKFLRANSPTIDCIMGGGSFLFREGPPLFIRHAISL